LDVYQLKLNFLFTLKFSITEIITGIEKFNEIEDPIQEQDDSTLCLHPGKHKKA